MVDFEIRSYGSHGDMMITRREKGKYKHIQGLNPDSTSTMFMLDDEIDEFIKALQKYANERGNQTV